MSIIVNQETVDRWIAEGQFVQFVKGMIFESAKAVGESPEYPYEFRPPADWTEAPPCPVVNEAGEHPVEHDGAVCWHCDGSGKQREAIQVPCDCQAGRIRGNDLDVPCHSLVTVAWATQTWGPLPVVEFIFGNEALTADRPQLVIHDEGACIWDGAGGIEPITLPPDIDPASLIGQWARGGTIERIQE